MKKQFFLGYMIHRLLQASLGRRLEDDRDHVMNKRLDLAGPLMATLFRQVFYKLTQHVQRFLKKCVDNGKNIRIISAVDPEIITRGFQFSLATGNWGPQKKGNANKHGVSQVRGVRARSVRISLFSFTYREDSLVSFTQSITLSPVTLSYHSLATKPLEYEY